MNLDYSLKTNEERVELVNKIIASTPPEKLTKQYLEILADYIINPNTIEQRSLEHPVITKNRQISLNKHEMSLEGFTDKLNSNSDAKLQKDDIIYTYGLTDRKAYLSSRYTPISQEDLDNIPHLRELHEEIQRLEQKRKTAQGKELYHIIKTLIEMRKDQYVLRASYHQSMPRNQRLASHYEIEIYEDITMDPATKEPIVDANVSLLIPAHVAEILNFYDDLRAELRTKVKSDFFYLLDELDELIDEVFKDDYPQLYDIIKWKTKKMTNAEVREKLQEKYGSAYSIEYISSLWKNKIPKMIAGKAQEKYIIWYYSNKEEGEWKVCSKCKQRKLAHPRFFPKNHTSKDGFYSICKECRKKKEGNK